MEGGGVISVKDPVFEALDGVRFQDQTILRTKKKGKEGQHLNVGH